MKFRKKYLKFKNKIAKHFQQNKNKIFKTKNSKAQLKGAYIIKEKYHYLMSL